MLVEPPVAPIDADVEHRDAWAVGEQRGSESVHAAWWARDGELDRERMRSMACLAVGGARLKGQPVFAGLTFADDVHGIVSRIAEVQRATTNGADPLGELSR